MEETAVTTASGYLTENYESVAYLGQMETTAWWFIYGGIAAVVIGIALLMYTKHLRKKNASSSQVNQGQR